MEISQFENNVTFGRIISVNQQGRQFTILHSLNPTSTIRFNVTHNTRYFNHFRRPIRFMDLRPGQHVRVRHAAFMTRSIPPQSTAIDVTVL